jgi:hypothetical protein
MADVLPAIAGANSSGEMVSGARWGGLAKKQPDDKRDREEMTKQMLMSKLTKSESLLGMQKGMNSALQAKLSALMKKCDEREQRVYTMRTAMQKVERDCGERIAKAEAENKAVLAGQKYEDMKDDLRRRATLIMDKDNAVAKMEKKSSNLERKNGALASQLSQAKEQTKEAEKQWGETSKEVVAMKSKQSHAGIKLREAKQSVRFLEVQLEERELEVAKLRVSVQMAEEDLGMAKREIRKQRDRADRSAAESFSPRDVPDIGNSAREELLEDELVPAEWLADPLIYNRYSHSSAGCSGAAKHALGEQSTAQGCTQAASWVEAALEPTACVSGGHECAGELLAGGRTELLLPAAGWARELVGSRDDLLQWSRRDLGVSTQAICRCLWTI